MKTSTDRILTFHVGSLPRPQPIVDMLFTQDRGESYDPGEFDKVIAVGVDQEAVGQALAALDQSKRRSVAQAVSS